MRSTGQKMQKSQPVVHEVKITLTNGRFEYKDEKGNPGNPVHASQGEKIQWSYNGPFAVHFKGISPCDKLDFSQTENTGGVPSQAPSGTYKYIVAVLDSGNRVYIDDPQVIIP